MEQLREYINAMAVDDQHDFAARCNTTLGYLRKAISVNAKMDAALVVKIERESRGAVPCESTRPDVDWSVLRDAA